MALDDIKNYSQYHVLFGVCKTENSKNPLATVFKRGD